jgi:hypothetical protein
MMTASVYAFQAGEIAFFFRPYMRGITSAADYAEVAILLFAAGAFLTWLSRAITLSAGLSVTSIPWTASKAVWGFFIPIVNLYQPYQVLRDLHDQLAPDGVPEPAPRPRMDNPGGYRHVAMEKAPPPRTLPRASIGAWWWLFIAERLLSGVMFVGTACAIAAALLAILVVRAIEGRLEERYRRVRHASDEELEAWGIPRP